MSIRLRARLVLLLALVVMVTGAGSPAHALVKPETVLKQGGQLVKSGKGITKFGRLVPGPVGAILTAGSLAWWAYDALDGGEVFAPQPGGSASDWLGGAVAYPTTMNDGMITATVTSVSGRTVTMEVNCSAWVSIYSGALFKCGDTSNGESIGVGTQGATVKETDCVNTTTGVHTIRTLTGLWTRSAWTSPSGTGAVTVSQTGMGCLSGEDVAGFRLQGSEPRPHVSATWFQIGAIGWGTMAGSTLPEGDLVFQTAVIEAKCKNAETGAIQTIRATSDWGTSNTLALPSCKARLGDEWYGVGVKVIPMDPEIDDLPLDPEIWPDWDVPDFVPEEWEEDITPDEEADPCHSTRQGCGLAISIDDEPVFPGEVTRTKIDTLRGSDPDRVTCKWGTREVDWKYCIPLLPTFEPGAGTSTTTDPTKPPTTEGTPTTGTGTQTVPTEAKNCMAGAFSWNPVDWVFVPVKCALKWAFIPSGTATFATTVEAFQTRPPGSLITGLAAAVTGGLTAFTSGGCGTLGTIPLPGDDLVISCPQITSMGGFSLYYVAAQALFIGSGVFAAFRMITGSVRKGGDG